MPAVRVRTAAALPVVLALLAAVVLALAAAPARATTVGLQDWTLPEDATLETVAAGGVRDWRVVVDWAAVETTDGTMDWTGYDALAERTARRGIRLLPVLLGCPASRCATTLSPPTTTASRRRAWARFVRAVAARYGRGGRFWAERPDVPALPIAAYQVWNEPNLRAYWAHRPDASAYLGLVRRTASVIRARDRRASVVLAGLAESRTGVPVTTYLRSLLRQRGARRSFDAAALNAYAATPAQVLGAVRVIRRILDDHGARARRLWLTEVGWATGGPAGPFRTSPGGQASRIGALLRGLSGPGAPPRIGTVYLFCLQDRRLRPGERSWFGPRTGLFDVRGRPKPAWSRVAAFAAGRTAGRLAPRPPVAVTPAFGGAPPTR